MPGINKNEFHLARETKFIGDPDSPPKWAPWKVTSQVVDTACHAGEQLNLNKTGVATQKPQKVNITCCWSWFNSFPISSLAAFGQVNSSACFSSSRPSTCFLKLANRRTQSSSLKSGLFEFVLYLAKAFTCLTSLQV